CWESHMCSNATLTLKTELYDNNRKCDSWPFLYAVPPSSMGESILSSLSAAPPSKVAKPTEQPNQSDPLQGLSDDTHGVSIVDDVAVEIITVTDYAEVELDTSTDTEVVMGENCLEGTDTGTVAEESPVVLPDETTMEEEVGEATQENAVSGLADVIHPEVNKDDSASSQQKTSVGPHDCPDCEKKFKFASALIAHRVIHTGERPHRCNDCGRCFSFRQSLDRHRHTHKTGRKYNCVICRETFHSLSARTEHKQTHMEDGVYTCHQCSRQFNWELALARHLKTHTADHNANSCASYLNKHLQTHQEERVYSCNCGKSFAYRAALSPQTGLQCNHIGQMCTVYVRPLSVAQFFHYKYLTTLWENG
uniref:C2H2-type domain-containing protein n=1 Tax=Sander lucioperca TaxID=283035 RepID=A0A8D0CUT1_SANLU